jgi:hypothetical protein
MSSKKLRHARTQTYGPLYALLILAGTSPVCLAGDPERPIDGIMDNSFFVEEAYNQEPGIVQHIFTGVYSVDRLTSPGDKRLDLVFTQEWPAYGQEHQLSYTVPYSFVRNDGRWTEGIGDVFLNYRYQAYFNEKTLTAFAPRFSLVFPTGDDDRGFGNEGLGYQWNLPFSTTFGDRLFAHANAGLTYLPDVGERPSHSFLNYNFGGSLIYCVSGTLNFMLEWFGYWSETVGTTGKAEREFASLISPGVRYAVNFKNGSQLVLGLGVPLGLTQSTPDVGVLFYVSFEHRLFGKEETK